MEQDLSLLPQNTKPQLRPLSSFNNSLDKRDACKIKQHETKLKSGERFAFGSNWARFLEMVDDGRIQRAEDSLKNMLVFENLSGKTFLDVGCGSVLLSLAAARLGAKVNSFDYDPQSVACTAELKRRYFFGGR